MSNQPAVIGPDGVARPYIGGQALIEGVMMRSPHSFAAVVRRRNGALVVRERQMPDVRQGRAAWPLVRGVVGLVEALKLGSASLRFSAEIFESDLEEADREAKGGSDKAGKGPSALAALSLPIVALLTQEPEPYRSPSPPPVPPEEPKGEGLRKLFTALSIVFALGLFVALPQAFAAGINGVFRLGLDVREPLFQVFTGAAKLSIVIGYMLLIRRLPEIYRVFQYHGAEHKSIYAYESGEELSVENARSKTTLHPRCGTTFLVMVALVSIFVFAAIGPFLPRIGTGGAVLDNVLFFLMKLPFLPVIAAITFELQRLLARHAKGPLRLLLWPGFLVQKITTIEPSDDQLEVALAALRVTLRREDRARKGEPPELADDETFAGFEALRARTRVAA